jgi:hypothetical protein
MVWGDIGQGTYQIRRTLPRQRFITIVVRRSLTVLDEC